jgi:hypothetical protein
MLAADKLQLQSALKQQATALKEKEFNLHHSNLMTVGTQAAVLAGLDITMFIELTPPADSTWGKYAWIARFLKFWYYAVIVSAFCANMLVVSHTTALSVLGAGLALRGPDGSMMTATDGLYEERKPVFRVFAWGLALTVGSVLLSVWLIMYWESALVCWIVALVTCRQMYLNYRRVSKRFGYDESLTVDFRDIMEGPAAIQVWSNASPRKNNNNNNSAPRDMEVSGGNGGRPHNHKSYRKSHTDFSNSSSFNQNSKHRGTRRGYNSENNNNNNSVNNTNSRSGLCGSRSSDVFSDEDEYYEDNSNNHDQDHDNSNDDDDHNDDSSDVEMQPLNSGRQGQEQNSGNVKRRAGTTQTRRQKLDASPGGIQTV